jgi:uncharacterized protein
MADTIDRPAQALPILQRVHGRRKRHWLRRLIILSVVLVLLVVGGLLGVGWYYSSQLLDVTHDPSTYSLRVLAFHGNTIELTRADSTLRPGRYGLVWHGGRALVGTIISSDQNGVIRRVSGNTTGLKVGSDARIDGSVYASPGAFHIRYRTVNVPDPVGPMPAWYVPGKRSTWVILVHGRQADRTDGLRPLPTLASLGLPVLDISYRNDVGAPASPDHLYHLGVTEWVDVEAGVRYALARGARDVILYGYSMGGGIVEYFLHHSAYTGRVRAAVLDAPAVDWSSVLDLQANQRGLPGILTVVAKRVIAYRLGLSSLDSLNAVDQAGTLHTPTLLFHGTADTTVPISTSDAFARARPDIVTYVRVAGAEHTQEWNVNPALYTSRLRAFLLRVLR